MASPRAIPCGRSWLSVQRACAYVAASTRGFQSSAEPKDSVFPMHRVIARSTRFVATKVALDSRFFARPTGQATQPALARFATRFICAAGCTLLRHTEDTGLGKHECDALSRASLCPAVARGMKSMSPRRPQARRTGRPRQHHDVAGPRRHSVARRHRARAKTFTMPVRAVTT